MNKFKVGDTVKVITDGAAGMPLGYVMEVESVNGNWLFFEDGKAGFYGSFALVTSKSNYNSPVKEKIIKTIEPGCYGKFEISYVEDKGIRIHIGPDGNDFFSLQDLEDSAKFFTDLIEFYKNKE